MKLPDALLSLAVATSLCFNAGMMISPKALLVLAIILSVASAAIAGHSASAIDPSNTNLSPTELRQAQDSEQQPRSVNLENSAPNEMTPEMSKEMHNFRQMMRLVLPILGLVTVILIGTLLVVSMNKKRKHKKSKRQ